MSIEVLIVAIASIVTSAGACLASLLTALHLRKIRTACCDVELSPSGSPSSASNNSDPNRNTGPTINIHHHASPFPSSSNVVGGVGQGCAAVGQGCHGAPL